MTPKERVYKTLNFEEPDLVPWGEHYVDYNVYEQVLGRPTLVHAKMRETQAWWDGHREEIVADYKRDNVDLALALGFDLVAVAMVPPASFEHKPFERLPDGSYRDEFGNLFHVSATTEDLGLYKMVQTAEVPTLEGLQDEIDRLEREGVPPPDDSQTEVIRHVVEKLGATHFIATFGPDVGWPLFGMTDEERYLNMALYPELIGKLAELDAKRALAALPFYATLGVDAVIGATDYGSSHALLASPRIMQEHLAHWMKAVVEKAHSLGLKFLKHSCGCLWEALPYMVDAGYDAYEGVQASAGMDMRDLKRLFGDKISLWGGVTNENLILGTPEQVRADALYAFRYGAPGGGFIYGSSHSLMVGTKPENLEMMRQVREQYGTYPIRLPENEGLQSGHKWLVTLPEGW